jgi:hypothetical protein
MVPEDSCLLLLLPVIDLQLVYLYLRRQTVTSET